MGHLEMCEIHFFLKTARRVSNRTRKQTWGFGWGTRLQIQDLQLN